VIHPSKNFAFKIQKLIYFHRQHILFKFLKRNSTSVHASLKLVYFHGRLAHFKIQKLVYFHGRPAFSNFQKELQQVSVLPWNWSIFTGNLSFLNFSKRSYFPEIGLFSRVTCPFWNSKTSLFSQAICPF